jgi:hypothetical protein
VRAFSIFGVYFVLAAHMDKNINVVHALCMAFVAVWFVKVIQSLK